MTKSVTLERELPQTHRVVSVGFVFMEFNEAIEKFTNWRKFKVCGETVKRYDKVLRIFCLYLHNPDIEKITIEQVLKYLNEMQTLGWKRNGVNIVCLGLRKFFEFWEMQGYHVIKPELVPILRKEFKIPRIANDGSYQTLLKQFPKESNEAHHVRNRAIVQLLWDTGARNGEILSLDLSDLDLKERKAIIKTEKSRGRRPIREIFWTEETNSSIKRWIEKRKYLMNIMKFQDANALFVSIATCKQSVRGGRMRTCGLAEILRTASNRAGIPTVNAHSMRHYLGRKIIEDGGSNSDVSNILGHSSMESSWIYTMMTGPQLRERWSHFKEPIKGLAVRIGKIGKVHVN